MPKFPPAILQFIQNNQIVSLSAHNQQDCWAACCFYAFDEEQASLIIMSKQSTRHGALMLENPKIAGTIAGQPQSIKEMEGIQFSAQAKLLSDKEEIKRASKIYSQKQPFAKLLKADIWQIQLQEIKHCSNKFIFAQKTLWKREENL